ncbi:hypothetical protein Tco_1149499 [Tanacetum coccineum]
MSDSEDSTVTYTAVSSPFEGLSDIGSLGVDGPPMMPEDPYAYVVAALHAPPSPDYVTGPEELEQAPLSLEFVPEPVYPKFIPLEDEVFPAEEQPLPAVVSPTTDSPRYIANSDLEENEVDPEEDPSDYPAVGGDDDDDESSDDDEDDDDDDVEEEEDEEEEEEHPALVDSVSPLIARLLSIPSPPSSPLSPWSSPLPQIPSPPLPVSSPVPVSPPPLPVSPTYPLGYRATMIRLRAETPSTSYPLPLSTSPSGTPLLLHIPLPTPSPPLLLPSIDCRACVFKSSSAPTARPTGGFRADYGFVATLDDEIRRDPERDDGYGITYTWNDMLMGMPGAPATDDTELGRRMTNFFTTVRQDTDEIYGRLDEAQDARAMLSGRSMDASDTSCYEVRALRTIVLAQQTEIAALRAADRARQAQLLETLRLMSTLQTHVTALQRHQGPASGPAQPEIPEEAGSSSYSSYIVAMLFSLLSIMGNSRLVRL